MIVLSKVTKYDIPLEPEPDVKEKPIKFSTVFIYKKK